MVTRKSAPEPSMATVSTAVLLPGFGSFCAAVTVVVFVTFPAAVGVTKIVTVAFWKIVSVPRAHVTVPADWLQLPCGTGATVAETNVMPAGNVSVRVTPVAVAGPPLLTFMLY